MHRFGSDLADALDTQKFPAGRGALISDQLSDNIAKLWLKSLTSTQVLRGHSVFFVQSHGITYSHSDGILQIFQDSLDVVAANKTAGCVSLEQHCAVQVIELHDQDILQRASCDNHCVILLPPFLNLLPSSGNAAECTSDHA